MNECLTTNRKSCYTAARVLRSRWQKFKYSNKGRVEGGDRNGVIDNVFLVWGLSSYSSTTQWVAIRCRECDQAREKRRRKEWPISTIRISPCSASLIPPRSPPPDCATVPCARTDAGCPSHDQNQYSAAESTHPRSPLALPLDPIFGVPGGERDSSDVGGKGGSGVASFATSADG